MKVSKVRNKGQITIPAEIRYDLGIKRNSKVYISIDENKIILQPLNIKYYKSLIGIGNTNGMVMKSLLTEKRIEGEL
jgi:AbrB family looped-hinge helix DNA binding protein